MRPPTAAALLLVLLPPTFAHFKLLWPPARGFNEDTLSSYPCGGQTAPSTPRTPFPLHGAPIQLEMGHLESNIQVLIAYGNDPSGDDFTTVLVPTFRERGLGAFCLGDVVVREEGAGDGVNATVLVSTNGDPSGGLYNCADVVLTSTQLSQSQFEKHCVDGPAVLSGPLADDASVNPNGTMVGGGGETGAAGAAGSLARVRAGALGMAGAVAVAAVVWL